MDKWHVWVKVFSHVEEHPTTMEHVVGYTWTMAYSGSTVDCVALSKQLSHREFVCQILPTGCYPMG
jgi:hypothetical protein